ncbi:unnamed protein product [Aphanomyces euteiches]|nr:hypothetical protein AeRB84_003105 [Aphanomyces euteiches]
MTPDLVDDDRVQLPSWSVAPQDDSIPIVPPPDDVVCEECEKRQAVFRCVDCSLTLCHKCTDALHIIPSLASHSIRHWQPGDMGFLPPDRTAPAFCRIAPSPALPALHAHALKWGDHVTFRDHDIAPGLLFGTVVESDQPRRGSSNTQYVRVLWIRGVVPLGNNSYQALLTLHHAWPVRVFEFVSMYHAFRAVVAAERCARKLWRREKYAGRLRKLTDLVHFPSDALLREILHEIHIHHLDPVMDVHMPRDVFLAQVSHPPLRDEGDEIETESDAPYPPLERVRVLLLPAESLTRPNVMRERCLERVVRHMVDLYIGFGWKALVGHMNESRRQERQAVEMANAARIQRWYRDTKERIRQEELAATRASGLDAMEVMRRAKCRQDAVVEIHRLWHKTLRRLKRKGVRQWKAVVDAIREPPPPQNDAPWHPGLGVKPIKQLPRVYAHMKSDGGLAVEDITKFKQFRQNHSGPTAVSYWIIRDRVLLGRYPHGQAFPEKRGKRVAARSDSITCLLLSRVSTFVNLLEDDECRAFEATALDADDRPSNQSPTASFVVDNVIYARHAKLKHELETAVHAAEKYVAMATKTLEQLQQRSVIDEAIDEFVLDLNVKKKALAENNFLQAKAHLDALPPVQVVHMPLRRNDASTESHLETLLTQLEARLRRGENLYIFSHDGRGRAGFLGALLLGRLYGLSPQQALERQQRCHDCQKAMSNLPSTRLISSPEAQAQINMVHQLLAATDTIYSPVKTTGEEYLVARAQRRGIGVQSFAATNGFMVESFPTHDAIAKEKQAARQADRIAKKEIRTMQLRWRRRNQAKETFEMALADEESAHMPAAMHQDADAVVQELVAEMVAWLAAEEMEG